MRRSTAVMISGEQYKSLSWLSQHPVVPRTRARTHTHTQSLCSSVKWAINCHTSIKNMKWCIFSVHLSVCVFRQQAARHSTAQHSIWTDQQLPPS